LEEKIEDIQQQSGDGVGFLRGSGESNGSVARFRGPITAGEIGNGEERFPNVSGTITEAGRDLRPGGADGMGMFGDELGARLAKGGWFEVAQPGADFIGGFAFHLDKDAAVGEGLGEVADGGDGFWAPGGKVAKSGFWLRVEG
jgi:hypothetical protein